MIWLSAFAATFVLLVALGIGLEHVDSAERENRLVETQLRTEQLYRDVLEARTQEVRRFRHDIDGLLHALQTAVAHQEGPVRPISEARGGSEMYGWPCVPSQGDARRDAGPGEPGSFTLMEIMLRLKSVQCAQENVPFTYDLPDEVRQFAAALDVDETDLCAMVHNLMENAYEESLRIADPADRLVSVGFELRDEKLVIEVRNRTASAKPPVFETRKDEPDQHGVGLRVIEDIVAAHDADWRIDFDSSTRMLVMRIALIASGAAS